MAEEEQAGFSIEEEDESERERERQKQQDRRPEAGRPERREDDEGE
jgi:hypothetical protein